MGTAAGGGGSNTVQGGARGAWAPGELSQGSTTETRPRIPLMEISGEELGFRNKFGGE